VVKKDQLKDNFSRWIVIIVCGLILPGRIAIGEAALDEDLITLAHNKFSNFGSEEERKAFETFFQKT
jgi:hypothetical protein